MSRYRSPRNPDGSIDPRQIEIMDRQMVPIFRAMSGAQRLKIAYDLYDSVRRTLMHYLSTEHPEWNAERVARETARRMSHGTV